MHAHSPNPISRAFRRTAVVLAAGLALAYALTCIADAIVRSAEISPTYIFLIIRIIVIIFLALVNLVALPFRHTTPLFTVLAWSALTYSVIGLIHAFTLTRKAEGLMEDTSDSEDFAPLSFFAAIISLGIFQATFSWCALTNPYVSSTADCVFSEGPILWVLLAILLIVFRNIRRSSKYARY